MQDSITRFANKYNIYFRSIPIKEPGRDYHMDFLCPAIFISGVRKVS